MVRKLLQVAVCLVEETRRAGCVVRLLGGVAIAERCGQRLGHLPELARMPNDIDLAGLRRERVILEMSLASMNLEPHREFNVLSGGERLLYFLHCPNGDPVRVDVVLDRLEMCHVLEFASRLDRHPVTISATDLLLSKLQVVFPSERDAKDTLALLATFDFQPTADEPDHLELDYLGSLCGSNWGWYHTVMLNLGRVEEWLGLIRDNEVRATVRDRSRVIAKTLTGCRKTLRWHLRSVIGERLRWYQIPEELVLG